MLITGIFVAAAGSFAGKPGKCSPWPACKDDGGGSSVVEPVVILDPTDSIAHAVTLNWIVPATSGGSAVQHYEVRYSTARMNDLSSFESGTLAEPSTVLFAAGPGTPEYFTIRGLDVDTLYFFGVRAIDSQGNLSELLQPESFISATTHRTALPNLQTWQVETVTDIVEDRRFHCCNSTSVEFDGAGNPAVAWSRGFPDTVLYAYLDSAQWVIETIFAGTDCQVCSMGDIFRFGHQPMGTPPAAVPSAPAVLFSHGVPRASKKGGRKAEVALVYAHRRGANDWVAEEVVRGDDRENGGLPDSAGSSMDFIYDNDREEWVPTVGYITTPLWNDPNTTYALVLAERQDNAGQGVWNPAEVFQCDATSASMGFVQLRRGTAGDLHAMIKMGDASGHWDSEGGWVTILHRPVSGPWQYWRSGRFWASSFNVDSQGNYYIAGSIQSDLVVVETLESIDATELCNPPSSAVIESEVVDSAAPGDFYANGFPDGPLIDAQPYSSAWGVHITEDGLANPPVVHLFARRNSGNNELQELRVFSRCVNSPNIGWVRDAVDRPHVRDLWRTVAVSDTAMAWAYNFGAASHVWNDPPLDRILIAQRQGNACM